MGLAPIALKWHSRPCLCRLHLPHCQTLPYVFVLSPRVGDRCRPQKRKGKGSVSVQSKVLWYLCPVWKRSQCPFELSLYVRLAFPSYAWSKQGVKFHKTFFKYETSPALPSERGCCTLSLINPPSRLVWSEEVGPIFSFTFWRGGSEVLDPWTGSAVLNILSTVCLPSADLPDMLSSRLAGDATSLRISPATREAPLHFLWINSHTVGEEERPGHRGTGAVMRRKHTHSFCEEQHTQSCVQYELPWSKPDESSESTQWIETTWNLFFNYSFTAYEVCLHKTGQSQLGLSATTYELDI